MIRVLHFISTPAVWSGVMSVIMNYYRHINRTMIQFDFLCFFPCENNYNEEIESYGGHVYYVKKPGSSMAAMRELDTFFKEHKGRYQWFHNHEVYLSFYLWRLAKRYDLRDFAIHGHATRYSDRWLNAIRNQILCYPIQFMKCKRIACSKAAGSFLFGSNMVRQNQVFIMYNAIDCKKYRYNEEIRVKLRAALGLQNKFVIGHVGRFERQKNHEFLIECFVYLKKQCPDSVLILIGTGSLKGTIEQKVKNSGLEDSVLFLGQQNNSQDWYQAMDMFWLPSLYEGLPMVAVEAQASGLPCLLAETITQEVELLDTTKRMSLERGPEFWASQTYVRLNPIKRDDAWHMVESAGFGIECASVALEQYYMNEGAR